MVWKSFRRAFLEVGVFQPPCLVHQSNLPDGRFHSAHPNNKLYSFQKPAILCCALLLCFVKMSEVRAADTASARVKSHRVVSEFGDFSFQVKYRAFSAPECRGDYFLGLFLGGSFPTGTPANGLGHTVLSPTFAAAKGIGSWDIQSTIGANLPASGANIVGRTVLFNTAVNYKIKGKIWTMLEQNSTFWSGGALDGKKQVFVTPGLVLGGFRLA
jgi:hypothetical protein